MEISAQLKTASRSEVRTDDFLLLQRFDIMNMYVIRRKTLKMSKMCPLEPTQVVFIQFPLQEIHRLFKCVLHISRGVQRHSLESCVCSHLEEACCQHAPASMWC